MKSALRDSDHLKSGVYDIDTSSILTRVSVFGEKDRGTKGIVLADFSALLTARNETLDSRMSVEVLVSYNSDTLTALGGYSGQAADLHRLRAERADGALMPLTIPGIEAGVASHNLNVGPNPASSSEVGATSSGRGTILASIGEGYSGGAWVVRLDFAAENARGAPSAVWDCFRRVLSSGFGIESDSIPAPSGFLIPSDAATLPEADENAPPALESLLYPPEHWEETESDVGENDDVGCDDPRETSPDAPDAEPEVEPTEVESEGDNYAPPEYGSDSIDDEDGADEKSDEPLPPNLIWRE